VRLYIKNIKGIVIASRLMGAFIDSIAGRPIDYYGKAD
jgi:hypothetical protein